jgi:hypothetical protein
MNIKQPEVHAIAAAQPDYLHMQAFNVVVSHPARVNVVVTVLAQDKDGAVPAARRAVAEDPGLRAYRNGAFLLSPVEAWKVHDWDALDQKPEVFSSRVQALECARFKGHGKFQIDELSRAVFYRDPEPKPMPALDAPAPDAKPVLLNDAERELIASAINFYCAEGQAGKSEETAVRVLALLFPEE